MIFTQPYLSSCLVFRRRRQRRDFIDILCILDSMTMNRKILERFAGQAQSNEMDVIRRACEVSKKHPMEGMVLLFSELHEEFATSPDESVSLTESSFLERR